ncbi:hypothetical protein HPB47_021512 [Ixodes persulcatus]|uniref:Uncharacterized protein n=1 Tax=Ixodes persulcatus TaxID=34615 RepID=A0AC60QEU8_IXOPE|nr:hypothetical protein HPB47_021512 [Ixodes persulcatus]
MDKPPKRQTHCFAPGCTTGYVSARKKGGKASVFAVPDDEERLRAWQRAIPRADKPLEKTSVVCELHFEPRFVVRHYTHVVNGEVVKIPRGRPCLSEDAIPTLFPNVPEYLSKKLPKKRQSRTSSGEVTGKKRKTSDGPTRETASCDDDGSSFTADGAATSSACTLEKLDYLKDEKLPSGYWSRHRLAEAPKVIAFSVCAQAGDSVCSKTLVLRPADDVHYHCSMFVQGVSLETVDVFDAQSVESLLHSIDQMIACSGFEESSVPEVQRQSSGRTKHRVHGSKVYSISCPGVSQDQRPCIQCRYIRKLLVNQASYKRKKASLTPPLSASNKLMKCARQLRREKAKVGNLKTTLERMKEENSCISASNLEASLSGLPQKQRQQVETCFQASKRKGTQGMGYSREWVLECILMRIKSPKLYEHIRKHKIMVLPSKSCLQKYVRNYKSSFGFNDDVFSAIAEKTKTMDAFQRHGGLLIDEMKLSENLKVTSSGFIEGFVDLGAYTSVDQSTETCDHGLVVLFQPQDPLENIFGILRQMSGSNDHPTPTQFLLSANCLAFCSLAKPPANGNVSPALIKSLLNGTSKNPKESQKKLDELMDIGCLNVVHELLVSCDIFDDHSCSVSLSSDSRIIYYVTGYVASRVLRKSKCDECSRVLLLPAGSELPAEACLTQEVDKGGLLSGADLWVRPGGGELQAFVTNMENSFTYCFSFNKLKANSVMDLISSLTRNRLGAIGCSEHCTEVSNSLIKFYALTRLHFLVQAENKAREGRRRRMRYLKLRRVT